MLQFDEIRNRIKTKGIRFEDIKHKGRLSDDEIASISPNLVFEWVRTGKWKNKDFKMWLKVTQTKQSEII